MEEKSHQDSIKISKSRRRRKERAVGKKIQEL
jgi:hypothetical protein